jgi:hypothetical protein
VPSAGDTVTVLYDPAAPGDDTSVFVTPARGDTAEDFARDHF